jgi:translation machinery-associated protein 16
MAPPKQAKKSGGKSQKKEKLFHPQSRKADQLVRAQHRKNKLADLAKSRKEKYGSKRMYVLYKNAEDNSSHMLCS